MTEETKAKENNDEHLITISTNHVKIPSEIKVDDAILITLEGRVVKRDERSNQDGTKRYVSTVKGQIATVKHTGKTHEVRAGGIGVDESILSEVLKEEDNTLS